MKNFREAENGDLAIVTPVRRCSNSCFSIAYGYEFFYHIPLALGIATGCPCLIFVVASLPHMSILAGVETEEGREIQKVYFLENKDHAEDHFTLDPRDQMNAIKDMRANGLKPLGNWHSHPSSPSRPSVEDIRLAFDSKASYLILSLMAEYPVLNSFHVESGVWEKEDLRIYSEEYFF